MGGRLGSVSQAARLALGVGLASAVQLRGEGLVADGARRLLEYSRSGGHLLRGIIEGTVRSQNYWYSAMSSAIPYAASRMGEQSGNNLCCEDSFIQAIHVNKGKERAERKVDLARNHVGAIRAACDAEVRSQVGFSSTDFLNVGGVCSCPMLTDKPWMVRWWMLWALVASLKVLLISDIRRTDDASLRYC